VILFYIFCSFSNPGLTPVTLVRPNITDVGRSTFVGSSRFQITRSHPAELRAHNLELLICSRTVDYSGYAPSSHCIESTICRYTLSLSDDRTYHLKPALCIR